jgi:hypothetical protein
LRCRPRRSGPLRILTLTHFHKNSRAKGPPGHYKKGAPLEYGLSVVAQTENPLYYINKTLMLFGDAKNFVGAIVRESAGHE